MIMVSLLCSSDLVTGDDLNRLNAGNYAGVVLWSAIIAKMPDT